jgi:hypothetical protein
VATTRTHRLSVFAVLGVAGLILTGCSSAAEPASAGSEASEAPVVKEQSLEEACTTLDEGALELQASLQEDLAALQSDPAAAAAAFQEAVDLFNENADKITNEEVKPAADKVAASFSSFNEFIQGAAADPASVNPEDLTAKSTEMQTAATELAEVCGTA